MDKHYLIFVRNSHSVVFFVQGRTPTDALWNYIAGEDDQVTLNADGSLTEGAHDYAHPLAYIEATEKIYHEWQIREVPDWAWSDSFAELFCGESTDGPPSVIADCRRQFVKDIPHSRANAFVWYLKEGALVTFYRKHGPQITVMKRYRWNWDGHRVTVEEWVGDHEQIVQALYLKTYRRRSQQGDLQYPVRPLETVPFDAYGNGSRIVVLAPDVAAKFDDSEAVNRKLRESLTD